MAEARIRKKTLDFLKLVNENNNREWFKANKGLYDEAHANMVEFSEAVLLGLKRKDDIATPSGKKAMYRIYRDVRFSKDKTPYTTWYSAYFRRATAALRGGYYFRVQAKGNSVVGGGFWGPNKEDLKLIRDQIAMDDEPLRKVLKSKKFKEDFGELTGEKLKTAPKGFDKEHPSIDLLRHKQFVVMKSFSDEEVLSDDFAEKVVSVYVALRPFFDVMSMYLTTDLNGESII